MAWVLDISRERMLSDELFSAIVKCYIQFYATANTISKPYYPTDLFKHWEPPYPSIDELCFEVRKRRLNHFEAFEIVKWSVMYRRASLFSVWKTRTGTRQPWDAVFYTKKMFLLLGHDFLMLGAWSPKLDFFLCLYERWRERRKETWPYFCPAGRRAMNQLEIEEHPWASRHLLPQTVASTLSSGAPLPCALTMSVCWPGTLRKDLDRRSSENYFKNSGIWGQKNSLHNLWS